MTPKPQGAIRPDSDELNRALRRLADASQTAHCLLDVAADFPHFPDTRDLRTAAPRRLPAGGFGRRAGRARGAHRGRPGGPGDRLPRTSSGDGGAA